MKITNDGAMMLLEEMVKSSADEFRDAVTAYVMARREYDGIKKRLVRALGDFEMACRKRDNALKTIYSELKFLRGEETVKPPIDSEYVIMTLIKQGVEDIEEGRGYEWLMDIEEEDTHEH